VAKMARFLFLLARNFIQRNVEGGLFEYLLVLYSVRRLNLVGNKLVYEGSTSGRLSVYLLNILVGGFFVFFIAFLFVLYVI